MSSRQKTKMTVDLHQDHKVLLLHCSITSIYFIGIFIFMQFSENVYNLASFKFIFILSSLVVVEILKLSITTFKFNNLTAGKNELTNSTKCKKTFFKSIKEKLKFCLAIIGITIIYYIAIVLFGAPVLTHYEETFMLALTLTTLTFITTSLHLGIDNAISVFTGSHLSINGLFVDAIKLNIKTVLLGTWISAFVLPLDWDRPWQAWPIPCVVGALTGYLAANCITFINVSTTKIKRKNKKSEVLKSC